tara:strand:- start:756 stop:1385 length:630 start_codon:yes stop_codon:yes gene_type:complete
MNKPKTIFCDIDGTLCKYPYTEEMSGYDFDNKIMKPLPGTLKQLWNWDKAGHMIILTTGRKESMRKSTERQLREAGIIYDKLIMGIGGGTRVLINDLKPHRKGDTAIAINLKRDTGISGISDIDSMSSYWMHRRKNLMNKHDKALFRYDNVINETYKIKYGALLCSECKAVLKEGFRFSDEEISAIKGESNMEAQYCDKCVDDENSKKK